MTKLKVFLSVIIVAIYALFLGIYNLYQSPIVGTANAQQLNDTVASYGWSKFVAGGGIPYTAFWLVVVALAIIWLSSIIRFSKSKNT